MGVGRPEKKGNCTEKQNKKKGLYSNEGVKYIGVALQGVFTDHFFPWAGRIPLFLLGPRWKWQRGWRFSPACNANSITIYYK